MSTNDAVKVVLKPVRFVWFRFLIGNLVYIVRDHTENGPAEWPTDRMFFFPEAARFDVIQLPSNPKGGKKDANVHYSGDVLRNGFFFNMRTIYGIEPLPEDNELVMKLKVLWDKPATSSPSSPSEQPTQVEAEA